MAPTWRGNLEKWNTFSSHGIRLENSVKCELYYFLFVFNSFVTKLGILQNQPPAIPVRVLTDKQKWRVCVKNVSEMSPALSNGGNNGVGFGTTSATDVLKFNFFKIYD